MTLSMDSWQKGMDKKIREIEKMTRAQVTEAQKLAREWKPKPNKSP